MKTTIELSDALLARARKVAEREGTTLRALVEEGLRRALDDRAGEQRPFRLRKATFRGRGLRPELEGTLNRARELAYEGRGG